MPNHTNPSGTVKIAFAGTHMHPSHSHSARSLGQNGKSLAEFFGWYFSLLQNVGLINPCIGDITLGASLPAKPEGEGRKRKNTRMRQFDFNAAKDPANTVAY